MFASLSGAASGRLVSQISCCSCYIFWDLVEEAWELRNDFITEDSFCYLPRQESTQQDLTSTPPGGTAAGLDNNTTVVVALFSLLTLPHSLVKRGVYHIS